MSQAIGTMLRDARVERGEEIGEVADALKIRRSHVVAMESENFSALGAAPYVRGHLRNYARHLGLDADQVVALWDTEHGGLSVEAHGLATTSKVSATRPRDPIPRWIVVAGLVVVVLAALAAIGQLGDRSPEQAPVAVSPTATGVPDPASTSTSTSTATSEPTRSPTSEPTPTPTPTPTPEGVNVLLAFQERVWVSIEVDGAAHPQSQTSFEPGEVLNLEGNERIQIRYGNAGGVDVEFNGERLGAPGDAGEVVDVAYTPDGPEQA